MHLSAPILAARRLRADRGGVAMLEFAFAFPPVLFIAMYGMEVANLALTNQRISQAALNLADNASRVGLDTGLPVLQLREVDVNDALAGARVFGRDFKLTEKGRITLSSLYHDGKEQRLQWQRCLGLKRGVDWDSSYGTAPVSAGLTPEAKGPITSGMGPNDSKVNAPPNSGVMFVEINYEYQPIFSLNWIDKRKSRVNYIASFIVRDRRDFSQIHNPAPNAARYTCDKYTKE